MSHSVADPRELTDLEDWGLRPDPLSGTPRQAGRILVEDAAGEVECGVWECTPGSWRFQVPHDEFCHVLEGRWRITPDSGPKLDLRPGDSVFRAAGTWSTDEVISTVRTIYMVSQRRRSSHAESK